MNELVRPTNRNANWYRKLPLAERLRLSYEVEPDGCWRWLGSIVKRGYGQVNIGGRPERAHRAMFEFLVQPIPDGMTLDHLCRNKACVNPDHLEVVSGAENHRRWAESITHCRRGHEFTAENTLVEKEGRRRCKQCRAASKERR